MNVLLRSRACWSWIAVPACIMLIAGLDVQAQGLRVTAANSANNDIYDVDFTTGSVLSLISDANSRSSIVSIAFVVNSATAAVDIVGADKNRNQIVIWPAPTSTAPATGVVFWDPIIHGVPLDSTHGLPGPVSPDGLSVDSALNIIVTSSKEGSNVVPSVWVFPRHLEGPITLNADYDLPLLVDSEFVGIDDDVQLLEETMVSDLTVGPVGVDDVLVAASDSGSVFFYTADDIASVLGDGGLVNGPIPLITTAIFPAPNNLEAINGNFFKADPAAGELELRSLGSVTGIAQIIVGALEQSNVDLADQFTKMIVTQRAYSSSATVLRTADEMTQQARDLKR